MVSMKDIAQRCGVSVATVSKALNGQQDIGEDTRRRICIAAEKMGYMTNSAARALKTNRTYNLGVLFVDERHSGLAHEYFSAVLESFKAEAEAHGYDITFLNHNVGGKPTTYLQHCRYRGLDGVVIACVDFNHPQVQELVDSGLPLVTIDHVFNNRLAVTSDNLCGTEALVRHVYEAGHRRIGNKLREYLHQEGYLWWTRSGRWRRWGWRRSRIMYAQGATTIRSAAPARRPRCWRCRSRQPAFCFPMIFPPLAA